VCHEHKFDAVSQKEFYEMAAFFNNTTQGAMDGNIKDTPPVIPVPRPEDRPRYDAVAKELAELGKQADARKEAARAEVDKALGRTHRGEVFAPRPHGGLKFQALRGDGGSGITVREDGQLRQVAPAKTPAWDAGHLADRAFKSTPEVEVNFDEAGDFEKHEAF